MPQPRKHASHAARQAQYRKRAAAALAKAMISKGLPPLPGIPTIPGTVRWKATVAQARALLEAMAEEIQSYSEDRSDDWQETERAQTLANAIDGLNDIIERLDELDLG
jgi:hypothetical protein